MPFCSINQNKRLVGSLLKKMFSKDHKIKTFVVCI